MTETLALKARIMPTYLHSISSKFLLLKGLNISLCSESVNTRAPLQLDFSYSKQFVFPSLQSLTLDRLRMKTLIFTKDAFPSLTVLSVDHLTGDCSPLQLDLPQLMSFNACHTNVSDHSNNGTGCFGLALSKCPNLLRPLSLAG